MSSISPTYTTRRCWSGSPLVWIAGSPPPRTPPHRSTAASAASVSGWSTVPAEDRQQAAARWRRPRQREGGTSPRNASWLWSEARARPADEPHGQAPRRMHEQVGKGDRDEEYYLRGGRGSIAVVGQVVSVGSSADDPVDAVDPSNSRRASSLQRKHSVNTGGERRVTAKVDFPEVQQETAIDPITAASATTTTMARGMASTEWVDV